MKKGILRDYQREIITRVHRAWNHHRSVMVQMPTGTGKTHVLASIVSAFSGKVLIVAHRVELVMQIRETVEAFRSFSSVKNNHLIKVESIQAVARRIDSTLNFIPDLVIIDEAHHALAQTYRVLWEKWPEAKFLGLTATPYRLNGAGFTDLFDTLIASESIVEFIRKGVLSEFDYVSLPSDSMELRLIDSLKKRGADGDYQVKEMDTVLNKRPSIERLYRSVREFADGKKGIVYAISISHARNIAAFYAEQGIKAATIDSKTSRKERKRLVDEFKAGEIRVLVNVDIFSEGFDCPDVEFIQMARPTLSLAKYLQQVGRGLRKSEGKKNCILIDNVGLCRVFGLPTQEWDWERMFRGELELEAWQEAETGLWGLKRGREKLTEAVFVTVFDTMGEWAAVRLKNNRCAWVDEAGNVLWQHSNAQTLKFDKHHFLLIGREGNKEACLDLLSRRMYESVPELRRYGKYELLKVRHQCFSRTRKVYTSQVDFESMLVAVRDFYLSIYEGPGRMFCLLEGDNEECYAVCRKLQDGSLVISDKSGKFYHAVKGREKECIGSDWKACLERIGQLEGDILANQSAQEEAKKRKILEGYREAIPYQAGLKWGLKVGNRITVPPIYRNVKHPIGKYCAVEMNYGQWGVITIDGTVLVEPKYPEVAIEENGRVILTSVTGKKEIVRL